MNNYTSEGNATITIERYEELKQIEKAYNEKLSLVRTHDYYGFKEIKSYFAHTDFNNGICKEIGYLEAHNKRIEEELNNVRYELNDKNEKIKILSTLTSCQFRRWRADNKNK